MAQSTVTNDGIQLYVPGTYTSAKVEPASGSVASLGVVTIIGEANEGPSWQQEAQLEDNAFTPDQLAEVIQKYGSGNIVEAFLKLGAAANDPNIVGAVSLIRILKTNNSQAASGTISRPGFGTYATLTASKRGEPGNLIKWRSEVSVQESAPDTGSFSYAPFYAGSVAMGIRTNGGAQKSITISSLESPTALATAIEDLPYGILATGGQEAEPLTGKSGLTLTAAAPTASTLVITLQSSNLWAPAPAVGDTLVIPSTGQFGAATTSTIAGGSSENVASYIVTGVTNTASSATITCARITAGSCVAIGGVVSAGEKDIITYKPLRIRNFTGSDRDSNVGISGQYTILSNDGTNVVVQIPVGQSWAAQPQAGDQIRVSAAFGGLTAGFYQVTSATSSTVSFYRLSNGSAGTTTLPPNIVSPITSSTEPFEVRKSTIDGLGKSMEITGSLESTFLNSSTLAGAGLSNTLQTSSAEQQNLFTISKQSLSQSFASGGEIMLSVGSTSASSSIEVGSSGITFKVGASTIFSTSYSQFKTLSDLVSYINSQTGWSASLGSNRFQSIRPSSLDRGTYSATGASGFAPARLKRDASSWFEAVSGSTLATPSLSSQSGQPEVSTPDKFLSGGTKAGSTSAEVIAAVDACEALTTNFIVPLFSRDADADIADGLTESSSTYAIDAINAYVKSHAIKMSAVEMRSNRLGLGSKRASYSACKDAAGSLSSFRFGLAFQDVKTVSADGSIKQFQPWMTAVVAAGMSAAAGYKGIVKKFANVSGLISPFGDFNPRNPGNAKDALKSGLLVMEPVNTGGFRWMSDQLTYTADNNFVYNSIQAVYLVDLIILTLNDRYDRAAVGQSVADISADTALGILAGEMFNYKRLKWIAASDGDGGLPAPEGYRNAKANIKGGTLSISCEIFLANLLYFVPIYLSISQVTQEA